MKLRSDTADPVNVEAYIAAQLEVLQGLRNLVAQQSSLLLPMDKAWQPTDYLPDLTAEDWHEKLSAFREAAKIISDEVLVVLVGDMVTEEALPSYAVSLNLIARDYTGNSDDPWAKWARGWTAEENRHGDLLNAYLRLTGRVDMRTVEYTVHHLIAEGFAPRAYPDLYAGLVYTSFQERATKISHANVGKLAGQEGEAALSKICLKIAGDESRHEAFYTKMMDAVMQQDPERAIMTFFTMMKKVIAMPGRLMFDGKDPDLFDHFSIVAQRPWRLHRAGLRRHCGASGENLGCRQLISVGSGSAGAAVSLQPRRALRKPGLHGRRNIGRKAPRGL